MCCGSSRSIGLRPTASILLGDEDGDPARYLRVMDGTLVPNVSSGAQRYFRGSSVEQAVDDGLLQEAMVAPNPTGKTTKFRVTLPSGDQYDFMSYATARQYAVRNGGVTSVIQEETDG